MVTLHSKIDGLVEELVNVMKETGIPIIITGGLGTGKTVLLKAISNYFDEVVELGENDVCNGYGLDLELTIQNEKFYKALNEHRSREQLLAIDNFQFLGGRKITSHLNHLKDYKGALVLTAFSLNRLENNAAALEEYIQIELKNGFLRDYESSCIDNRYYFIYHVRYICGKRIETYIKDELTEMSMYCERMNEK